MSAARASGPDKGVASESKDGVPSTRMGDAVPGNPKKASSNAHRNAYHDSNCFSRLGFSWMGGIMRQGFEEDIKLEDLPTLPSEFDTKSLFDSFDAASDNGRRALGSSLYRMAKRPLWATGVLAGIYAAAQVSQPLLLKYLIISLQRGGSDGVYFVTALFLCQVIGSLSNQAHLDGVIRIGQKWRALLMGLIYKRALVTTSGWSTGSVLNLMSNDSSKFFEIMPQFHLIWAAPLQILVTSYFLIDALGVSALAGIGMLVVLIPVNAGMVRVLAGYRRRHMPISDRRLRLCGESLAGMRTVKFFSWERRFLEAIDAMRDTEGWFVRREMGMFVKQIWIMIIVPSLGMAFSFGVFVLSGKTLDAATVFSSLAFFNVLRFPLMYLGAVIVAAVQARIALRRTERFLSTEGARRPGTKAPRSAQSTDGQVSPMRGGPESIELKTISKSAPKGGPVLQIHDAVFTWPPAPVSTAADAQPKETQSGETNALTSGRGASSEGASGGINDADTDGFRLHNINMAVDRGNLVVVIGQVGSGKSMLMESILGETVIERGTRVKPETVAYAPQHPWIMGTTVRENILFNSDFDPKWYYKVLDACALTADLKQLSHGDQTVVGERGVTLSGGQKARLSLARAVYARKPLLIADDPLSALDAHTGAHVFQHVFAPGGIARDSSAVVLVTHAAQFLSRAKRVAFLHGGRVAAHGSFADIRALAADDAKDISPATRRALVAFVKSSKQSNGDSTEEPVREKPSDSTAVSTVAGTGKLHTQEERERGVVSWSVYQGYIDAAGGWVWVALLILALLCERVTYLGADWWLTRWIKASRDGGGTFGLGNVETNEDNRIYLLGYVLWVATNSVFVFCRLYTFARGAGNATLAIFKAMSLSVFRSPMRFFETTPLGRIVNRFSYDTEVLDMFLLDKLNASVASCFWMMSAVTVICAVQPIMAPVIVLVLSVYYKLQLYYRRTSVQLQRLDSISRSPIHAIFTESLVGASTIRSFGEQNAFTRRVEAGIQDNGRAVIAYNSAARWLGVRLESLGAVVTLATGLLCWAYRDAISPELVGFAMLWSFNFTISLGFMVNKSTEAESKMNSVERMLHYCKLPSEAPLDKPSAAPGERKGQWPTDGKVEFDNVVLRYGDELEPALRGCSFTALPGEKIGVVGRTGAGKSTLATALFRLRECSDGLVRVDDVDISTLGLSDVRGRGICIIPQDPVLFSGTLRYNIDPFDQHQDREIWDALRSVRMAELVGKLPGGLSSDVVEGGANFSVGQRQLICVVRAIVLRPKVLVVDEATASVDPETDTVVQAALRREFKGTTMLTIAHRIHSVMDSDKVLVMDRGRVVEFDSPMKLIQNGGVFKALVDAAGAESEGKTGEDTKRSSSVMSI